MGAAGTDAAIETADVALMSDDLRQLPFAVALGHRALRIIQANIGLCLMTKAALVLLTVLGQATLWIWGEKRPPILFFWLGWGSRA